MAQLIVNPDVDGVVYRHPNGGSSGVETWAAIRDGNGNQEDDTTTTSLNASLLEASSTTDRWRSLWRGVFVFPMAGIPVGSTVDSATFQFFVNGKGDGNGGSHQIALIDGASASDSALAVSDYQTQGTTKQATNLTVAGISTSAYNTWTLNATGFALLEASLGGFAKLGLRLEADRANSEPTWGSSELSRIFGEFDGSGNEPILTIDYTPAPAGGRRAYSGLI